jgi:hypothetical protein
MLSMYTGTAAFPRSVWCRRCRLLASTALARAEMSVACARRGRHVRACCILSNSPPAPMSAWRGRRRSQHLHTRPGRGSSTDQREQHRPAGAAQRRRRCGGKAFWRHRDSCLPARVNCARPPRRRCGGVGTSCGVYQCETPKVNAPLCILQRPIGAVKNVVNRTNRKVAKAKERCPPKSERFVCNTPCQRVVVK